MSLRPPRFSPSRGPREEPLSTPPRSAAVHCSNEKMHPSHKFGAFHPSGTKLALWMVLVVGWTCLLLSTRQIHSVRRPHRADDPASSFPAIHSPNPYALSPGELPGYTGWARPEQTLAGYFFTELPSSSSPSQSRYHAVVRSGETFTLRLRCLHDENTTYYLCPPTADSLFYVRAYGPSVITGNVVPHPDASYSIELHPIDAGLYTVEVILTFSAPFPVHQFPLPPDDDDEEPGYEGYSLAQFPMFLLVEPPDPPTLPESSRCTLAQLTESSPLSSLTAGYWRVVDHVGRASHRPLTPEEEGVSLDGYRMGLNSLGVRMQYVYEGCELMSIREVVGESGGRGHVMEACLRELGYGMEEEEGGGMRNPSVTERDDHFHGVNVIFIGDSVMKLEMGFFNKLLAGSMSWHEMRRGVNVTFIESNGGIHATLSNILSTLKILQSRNEKQANQSGLRNKSVILFNSGLHDIDVLCSSKRRRSRNVTTAAVTNVSCVDAYRDMLMRLVTFIDAYPAEIKVFRTTTAGKKRLMMTPLLILLCLASIAGLSHFIVVMNHCLQGWPKYGNYGFTWPATEMQPQSRSTHTVYHFNQIAHDVIRTHSTSIYITDGYWITLPRPDHTQTSEQNQVGKHLVHPGYEVLSVFARRWLMLILWGLCRDSIMT